MSSSADPNPFRFHLLQRLAVPGRGEGVVIERSQRAGAPTRYRLRVIDAKGRMKEVRLTEAQLDVRSAEQIHGAVAAYPSTAIVAGTRAGRGARRSAKLKTTKRK